MERCEFLYWNGYWVFSIINEIWKFLWNFRIKGIFVFVYVSLGFIRLVFLLGLSRIFREKCRYNIKYNKIKSIFLVWRYWRII